jgi:hypothetical protein
MLSFRIWKPSMGPGLRRVDVGEAVPASTSGDPAYGQPEFEKYHHKEPHS